MGAKRVSRSRVSATVRRTKPRSEQRTFATLVRRHSAGVRRLAEKLRRIVRGTAPELAENIYGGRKVGIALYSLGAPNNVLCGIQAASDRCLLYIHHVVEQDSTALRLEGKGHTHRHRHVRFEPGDRVPVDAVVALLKLARSGNQPYLRCACRIPFVTHDPRRRSLSASR